MEMLGVAASTLGVIGFALKGLALINDLRAFSAGLGGEGACEFLRDIDTSARILIDVKDLCEEIECLFPSRSSDFRIASLQVQVEDCTRDLQQIFDVAKKRMNSKKRTLFKEFIDHVTKSTRIGPHERFRVHQENMKAALTITGRWLNIEHSTRLHGVGNSIEELTRNISMDNQEKKRTLESLSSNGSCVLALSRTANDRMKDVQSNTEGIASKLDILLELLSSSSSGPGSSREEWASGEICQFQAGQKEDKQNKLTDQRTPCFCPDKAASHDNDEAHVDSLPKYQTQDDMDFGLISQTSKALATMLHRNWHPFLADYACTWHAWHTNELCARFIDFDLPTGLWAGNSDKRGTLEKVDLIRQITQGRILALRKACLAEGLGNDLRFINAELGMTDSVFNSWDKEEFLGVLSLKDRTSSSDSKRDRLTRINEWLLEVRESHEHLAELHRNICYSRKWELDLATGFGAPGHSGMLDGIDWERTILKYWFLDIAAIPDDRAHSSLGGGDSEATFRQLEGIDHQSDNENEEREDMNTLCIIKNPPYPVVKLSKSQRRNLESFAETPAEGVELHVLAAAKAASATYSNEKPGEGLCPYRSPEDIIATRRIALY